MKQCRNRTQALLCAVLFLSSLASVHAQKKPLITVLPFSAIEVSASVSMIISQLFETHLVNTGSYDVLSQNEREKILAAQAQSLSGCTDESCAVEIGRLLAAEQIIIGTVAALGTKFIINAKIIDVTTSKTLGADMISAASIEELDSACRTLTYNLVAKAVQTASPAGTTAPVAAPASQPAGTRESDEAAAARTRPKKERPVREPRPEPVPGEFDLLGFLSHGGGVLLRGAGSVLGVAAAEMRISSLDAWNEYINAEADAEDLYTDYSTIADMYDGTNIVSLSIAGGAALASSASWLLTDSISLSTFGRIGYALGSVMELGGSVLGLASLNQSAELHALYRDYLSAAEGAEDIYALYLTNREAYAANRSLACGLWAAGSAFLIASPLLPGEKTAAAPSLWNRALLALGSLLMSAGNITATAAMGARIEAEGRYEEYMAAEDPAEFYDSYLTAYKAYTASSWISYCLWAGGGIMTLVSLFVPMASPAFETAELPFSLSILPAPLGVGAEIRITLK